MRRGKARRRRTLAEEYSEAPHRRHVASCGARRRRGISSQALSAATPSMSLTDEFCFAHESLFLVPAEELSAEGISPGFAARLQERGVASPAWRQRFDEAFALYWKHAQELAQRAPRHWLPPRAQNLCVALDPLRVRPFFQPLGRASCLLEHGDFEPRTSSL